MVSGLGTSPGSHLQRGLPVMVSGLGTRPGSHLQIGLPPKFTVHTAPRQIIIFTFLKHRQLKWLF